MAKVLLVGVIRELLEERRKVLETARYQVALADNLPAAYQAIEHGPFDVAVLGYSFPEQDRSQLARMLRNSNPDIKIIMLYFSNIQNTELADALLPTSASAEDLLRTVNHILKTEDRSETL